VRALNVPPRIIALDAGKPEVTTFAYGILDHALLSNAPLRLAHPFRLVEPLPERPPPPGTGDVVARVCAEGLLGAERREVACTYRDQGVDLQVPGIGDFRVDAEAGVIRYRRLDAAPTAPALLEEALFGPALIVALAFRSRFLLHAGAVRVGEGVAAFCAESGTGKSTLAGRAGGGWRPIAEDMLPVAKGPDGFSVLPRFPQLKWPEDAQYPLDAPPRLPLRALFVLAPDPPDHSPAGIRHERLDWRDATLALIRHGVAGRLFSQQLLELQMRFFAEAAGSIPVFRLRYPKRLDILPALRERIQEVVGELGCKF
jgi:hypothetical protein